MTVRQKSFDAIGTKWRLEVRDPIADDAWVELLARIDTRVQEFDQAYSRFRSDSLVSRMAETAGRHSLPADGFELLKFYEELYEVTDGKVTPLIGQVMNDAGYDAAYSLQPKQPKSLSQAPRWEDVISYDTHSVTLEQPALLDFGAAGKGYLVDIIAAIMSDAGAKNFTVDASGDILHRTTGKGALQVGMENPQDASEAIGIVQLHDKSLCASAGSKRQWGEFNHIIDPQQVASPKDVLATWVIADDTMTADGLATALFFTKPAKLVEQFDFSWAVLDNDMSLERSRDFPAQLFELI